MSIPNRWSRLRDGSIVGIIDSYGAVHSQFCPFNESKFHEELFYLFPGFGGSIRWRWNYDDGIGGLTGSTWTPQEYDQIRTHLTKKYGIRWWENGFHDLDFLESKMQKEETKAVL